MFHFSQAFEDQVQFSLHSVRYEKVKPDSLSQPYQPITTDRISIAEKSETGMTTLLQRDISFDPIGLFSITVSFEIVWTPKNWPSILAADDKQIIDAMMAEKSVFLCSIASRISLLIAQLTSSVGLSPMITPPELMVK